MWQKNGYHKTIEQKSTARHEIQNYEMPLESHVTSKALIPESLSASESSQEKQILVFVIVRFVNLQDGIMFLIFYICSDQAYVLLSCFYLLMIRGVDLIDITSLVGWGIFDIFYIFMLFEQSCVLRRGEGLNIDKCLIKGIWL